MANGGTTVSVRDAAGNRVELSPEEARSAYLRGEAKPTEERVRISKGDRMATVDASEVKKAMRAGWVPSSAEGHRKQQLKREESTLLGQAQGTAEAFGSGLTMGASDYLVQQHYRSLGDRESMERYRARNEAAGAAADTARLAGELAPVLLSGGGAAAVEGGVIGAKAGAGQLLKQGLKRGIRSAGAIPRGVEAAGALAEKGVVKALGSGLKGRTAGAFARGAVEGGASGLGDYVTESVLGDKELTAEQALWSFGTGALFGGATSSAFPLTGAAIRKGTNVTKEGAAKLLAKATDGNPKSLLGLGADVAQAAATGRDMTPGRLLAGKVMEEGGVERVHKVLNNKDELISESAAVVKQASQDFAQAADDIVRATEAARPESFRKHMSNVDAGVAKDVTQDELLKVFERIQGDEGLQRVARYSGNAPMHRYALDEASGLVEKAYDDIQKLSDAADIHQRGLQLKRDLQRQAKQMKGLTGPDIESKRFIKAVTQNVDDLLQHDVFGDGGRVYRELRDVDRSALQARASHISIDSKTGMPKGKTALGRLMLGTATDRDAALFSKRLGNADYVDQLSSMKEYVDLQKKSLEVRAKYSADPDVLRKLEAGKKAIERFEKTVKEQTENFDIADAAAALGKGGLAGPLAMFGPSGATVAGALLGGAPGMAVGALLNAAARPQSVLRTAVGVMYHAEKAGVDVKKVIKNLTDGKNAAKAAAADAAPKVRTKAKKAAGKAAKAGRTVAVRLAGRSGRLSDDQDARAARAAELADPDILARELATEMHDLDRDVPGVSGVMVEKIAAGAAFLQSKMPPRTVDPLTGQSWDVDQATRAAFDRYYEAVTDPMRSMQRLEDGTFTAEHGEALREVWPAMYKTIQDQVLMELQQASDDGRAIPYTSRVAIGVLMHTPTDVTMTPEFMAAMRSVHGGGQQAEAAQAGPAPAASSGKRTRKTTFKYSDNYATTAGSIGSDS